MWMYFRFINMHLPSNVGDHHLNNAKGPSQTTWIWNIHASTHQVPIHHTSIRSSSKVLSSHSCHLSPISSWLSSMHYHGAYYSNYHTWMDSESNIITPSSHLVWSLIGQESYNTSSYLLWITPSCDSFYTGIQITTGLFHLWHSTDIYSTLHLQHTCMTSIITTITYTYSPTHPPNTHISLSSTPTLHHQHPLTILGSSSIT